MASRKKEPNPDADPWDAVRTAPDDLLWNLTKAERVEHGQRLVVEFDRFSCERLARFDGNDAALVIKSALDRVRETLDRLVAVACEGGPGASDDALAHYSFNTRRFEAADAHGDACHRLDVLLNLIDARNARPPGSAIMAYLAWVKRAYFAMMDHIREFPPDSTERYEVRHIIYPRYENAADTPLSRAIAEAHRRGLLGTFAALLNAIEAGLEDYVNQFVERKQGHLPTKPTPLDLALKSIGPHLACLNVVQPGMPSVTSPSVIPVEMIARLAEAGDSMAPGPSSKRLAPSRAIAAAAYEWGMTSIKGADKMIIDDLLPAIRQGLQDTIDRSHPGAGEVEKLEKFLKSLPNNSETFRRYLNDAGIKRYNTRAKGMSQFHKRDDLK